MVSDDEPGFDPLGRSVSCAADSHQDCGHVGVSFRRFLPPEQMQSTVVLCRCACHAACLVTGWRHVPLTAWQELCTCPGNKPQRAWKEDPDEPWPGAREQREQRERQDAASRDRRDARRQAFEAARAAGAGKTRDQVRQIYLDELRARGQEQPAEPLLEARIDLLVGRPLRALAKLWQALRWPASSPEP